MRTMTNDFTNQLLIWAIKNDILLPSDVIDLNKEAIMETIISRVHQYKITKPSSTSKDKRWFTYVPDETKPNGRRRVCKKTETELFDFLLTFYGVSKESSMVAMSFGELFEEWCQYKENFVKTTNKKKSLSPSTIHRYRNDYRKCIKNTVLDSKPISEITSILLENELKEIIMKHTLSESYAKNLLGYISNVFSYAIRKRYITTNEFAFVDKALILSFVSVKPPKCDADRVLTSRELKSLLNATRAHESRHPEYLPDYAIEFACLTGMRVGEIAALHWTDIHDGLIHIDYSEHRLDFEGYSELVIDEPKNLKHRKFPLNDAIEELLKRIKSLGFNSEFVFGTNDKRYTGHDVACACDRRASEAGIKKTSIHGIRRTVASELRKTANPKMVANLLGHLEETDENYYNYDNSEFEEKKALTESLCSNVLNIQHYKKNKKIAEAL